VWMLLRKGMIAECVNGIAGGGWVLIENRQLVLEGMRVRCKNDIPSG
jgi:hypothetical protein